MRGSSFISIVLAFTVASSLRAGDDAYEPNNTIAAAQSVPLDTDVALVCQDDDWFKFTLPANGTLEINLLFTQTNDQNDIDMVLIGPDQTTEIARSESGDDNERIRTGPLAAGTYYLHVYDFGALNNYTLHARVNDVDIVLPELLAVELPTAGTTQIDATQAPISTLLSGATAGALQVTNDRASYTFPLGPTLVTWTAWAGTPNASAVKSKKSAYVWVFRHGQTPLGVASNEQAGTNGKATGANQGYHVVRDSQGRIHTCWFEGDLNHTNSAYPVYYRMGTQDPNTGDVTWGAKVQINDGSTQSDRSLVAMGVSANYVHFAWAYVSASNQVKYRRMALSDGTLGPIRTAISAGGTQRGNCPGLAVRNDNEAHIVCGQNGVNLAKYARTLDGGSNWTVEDIPSPDQSVGKKGPTVAVDSQGNAHVLFTYNLRNATVWSPTQPNDGYWQLYYTRRNASGGWTDGQSILDAFPEWTDAHTRFAPTDTRYNWDVLADWADMEIDENDTIHVGWHGSTNTHIFGNDEAHYSTRPSTGSGTWGAWTQPMQLLSHAATTKFSFCPSICVDVKSNLVIPVIFYGDTADTSPLDSAYRIIHKGALEGSTKSELSQMVAHDINTWFPCAAPRLYRHSNGRVWMDVVSTAMPWGNQYEFENFFVVYQHEEVTSLIYPDKASSPNPANSATNVLRNAHLSWTNGNRSTGADVYFGTSATAVANATNASPEFKGQQAATTFTAGLLNAGTTYYWRIDCVNARGTTKGDVWSFTTGSTNSNQAPQITSVSANPTAAVTGQAISFSVVASDPDSDALTFVWDFKDGTTLNGANVQHAFTLAGTYGVVVTVTDVFGASATQTVTVTITSATGGGDGGTGGGGSGGGGSGGGSGGGGNPPLPMTITKFGASVKFSAPGGDKLTVYGSLLLPGDFNPSGQSVTINAGGAPLAFTLSSKGKARSASGSFDLKLPKRKKGVPPPTGDVTVTFRLKASRGAFASAWSDEGVNATAATGTSIPMLITLSISGKDYAATVTPTWSVKGKSGGALK